MDGDGLVELRLRAPQIDGPVKGGRKDVAPPLRAREEDVPPGAGPPEPSPQVHIPLTSPPHPSASAAGRRITPEPLPRAYGTSSGQSQLRDVPLPIAQQAITPSLAAATTTSSAISPLGPIASGVCPQPAAAQALSAGASNGGGSLEVPSRETTKVPAVQAEEEEEEAYKISRIAASQSATPSEAGRPVGCSSRSSQGLQGREGSVERVQQELLHHSQRAVQAAAEVAEEAIAGASGTTPVANLTGAAAAPANATAAATAAAAAAAAAAATLAGDRSQLLLDMCKELVETKELLSEELLLPNMLSSRTTPTDPPPPDTGASAPLPATGPSPPSSTTPLKLSDAAEVSAFLEGQRCTLSALVGRLAAATGAAEAAVRAAVTDLAARKSYAVKEGEVGEDARSCFSHWSGP